MTVAKPISKLILRPVTTAEDSGVDQSEFLAIRRNLLKARQKSRVHGFASHWLKNWLEIFKPITERIYCNRGIIFDSHLENCSVMNCGVKPKIGVTVPGRMLATIKIRNFRALTGFAPFHRLT